MIRLFTLIILLTLSLSSFATYSGNDVIHECPLLLDKDAWDEMENVLKGTKCAGYLNGLNDMAILFQTVVLDIKLYCLPENGIETGQLIRVTAKWLEANPEVLHESMRSLFIGIMKEAFPCNNQSAQ